MIEPALEKAEKRAKGKPGARGRGAAPRRTPRSTPRRRSRDAGLSRGARSAQLRPIAPLTIKPEVVVANLEEGTEVPAGLAEGTVGVYASIEAETAEMDAAEARALLEEFGVHEPGSRP